MTRNPLSLKMIVSAAAPAAALLIIAYFAFAAVAGPNGALSFGDYARSLDKRQAEMSAVVAQRAALQHRMDLLDPRRGADPDYVDELVRQRTGQLRQDEVILRTH